MKRIVFVLLAAVMISGCAMKSQNGEFVKFKNHKILSEKAAQKIPREKRAGLIKADMDKVGFKKIKVSYVVDSFTDSVLGVFKNQYAVMEDQMKLLDNHRDVRSFLMANKGKSKKELEQAVTDFDAGANQDSEKIGPKIADYNKAAKRIEQANNKLTGTIAVQTLKVGVIFAQDSEEQKEFLITEGLTMLFKADKLYDAYQTAEVRLHLAKLANDFIKDEKAIIDISKQLQDYQNAN